ncbi:6-carboxytetrahydropterin synthase [Macrococcus hajekii]|uniref:6-carboxy-5,6,7,8-tetrahydropterin synthase n=1 Tax=Macrococcus hajekii TaxID=198482 RepID=A0A4V3BDV8_9STAP|nr:6-pyruvoyl tetrahydropterin synthase family protein [Macrococcus hajekii]TDM01514.1 6-carboxytetrahydropterin synthase [Macrococcus hajekii]GGB00606.1 6-carboxy-5,6,7,8-tetrahydropterin synthase [Macrococcus hajekii]
MIPQLYPQVPHNYIFELNKDMNFSSAHYIPDERAGACARVHGHTYFLNLTIGGNELDELGFLINFSELKQLIHGRFDHQLLNELPELAGRIPSTEKMAELIHELVQSHLNTLPNQPQCLQVFLRETPTSYVVYRGAK